MVLFEGEKATLAEIAHRLGRKALEQVAATAQPDTILGWYRKLVALKFDGSKFRQRASRPKVQPDIENLVVRMARENPGWGYDRIVGALANLGHRISDQTVGNILKRHGLSPARKRRQTVRWKDFIRSHMAVLTGADFFTVEILTLKGLVTYYVLFFHAAREPEDLHCWNDVLSGRGVDRPAGAKRDPRRLGIPERLPVPAA